MIEKSIFKDGANKNLTHPKRNKGITLIALVITIVVLIILSGVAISLSLGENGIFNKAKFATEEYKNAEDYEEEKVAEMTNEIDKIVGSSRNETQINYSTQEQDTGLKWTNNKPVYEKTFNITYDEVISKNSRTWHTISKMENIDEIIELDGFVYVTYDNATSVWKIGQFQNTIINTSPYGVYTAFNYNYSLSELMFVMAWANSSNGNLDKINCTIRYTKTTDTATNE